MKNNINKLNKIVVILTSGIIIPTGMYAALGTGLIPNSDLNLFLQLSIYCLIATGVFSMIDNVLDIASHFKKESK